MSSWSDTEMLALLMLATLMPVWTAFFAVKLAELFEELGR